MLLQLITEGKLLQNYKIIAMLFTLYSYPGGFGGAKIGANYGPTLQYYDSMIKKGYQQVLWLVDDK